jgi:hypothetical protein
MRKPIATVQPNEAFKILAAGFRYNPYRLALLRRIYVGRFSHSEASCQVQSPRRKPSSPRP